MSSQPQKRKHKTLTIKEKNDILERLNRNESFSSLASEYGVGRSTIYDIKKNRENIQKFMSTTDCGPGKRQTLKKAKHPEVEEALYMWFRQERNKHTPISEPILATKAKFFYKEITKKDDFLASKGWLERFKNRYGIRLMAITGENLSNDTSCIELFKLRFFQKVKDLDLCPSQVYNADESGLFWRVIPSKTFVSYNDNSVPIRKVIKERVTILPCANAAGTHALKMAVIGKSNKPRAFKNIDIPVHYYGQKSAWMTKDLFKKWFDECFVPEVRKWLKDHNLAQKALLLLDNGPGHPSEEELTTNDKFITAMFIPPNCTALLQPMEQHIIQFVKQDYKKNLLLRAISKDQPIETTLKEFNMKDFVFALCQSWNALPPSTITSSWKNLWPDIVTTPDSDPQIRVNSEVIEQVAVETQISSQDLEIWIHGIDKEENVFHEMSDEEIINQVSSSTIINKEDDDDVIETTPQVAAQDAINAFELGLQWAEENGASCDELLLLRRLRDKALVSRFNNVKQPTIYKYFHAS
ncbi:unnamed protein product [Parnassius apollo]|uniref:(apollo) hypothetical protein n=1 Tax=Parnassius apollo TaxID=110799 RepID=A0A8S3WFH7_PARAO|nr:unnamed protein product [Parnassius apollo]